MRRVVLLIALTACGDNVTGLDLDDYGTARRSAECERLTRCGLFSTQDACERYLLPSLDRDTRAAIDEKKIAYNGAAANQCLEAVAAQSCDATSADARITPPACTRVFTGLVDDGATCAFDGECASGSCDAPSCRRDMCCMGQCQPTIVEAPTDATCARDADCADGFCGTDLLCHPRIAVREACTRDGECDFDLACIGATEFDPGRCRDLPLVGEICPYQRCAEIGTACVNGSCAPVGIAGAPCTGPSDCSVYGECAPNGQCAELPTLGQPCTLTCAIGAWCNDTGTCDAPIEDGAACIQDAQCPDRYCATGPVFDTCAVLPTCI